MLEIDASELSQGQRLLLPDGETTAHVLEVDTVLDDYGHPALYFAALDNHVNLRVAHGTTVRITVPRPRRPADLLFAGPTSRPAAPEQTAAEEGRAAAQRDATPAAGLPDPTEDDGARQAPHGDPLGARAGSTSDGASAFEREAAANRSSQGEPGADSRGRFADEPAFDDAPLDSVALEAERPATKITLDTGDVVVVPGKAPNRTTGPTAAQLNLIPQLEGNPEDLIRHIDAVHPGRHTIHTLAERLGKGINTKSGACLRDLRDLAYELYLGQADAENALKIADMLAVVPFDGNPGRWSSVESALALAAHLARERNEEGRAAVYSDLLRAPETAETDPFRARMAARVRQRTLNEPNLYDKEVTRAAEKGDDAEERSWRVLRLDALLHLRAHGGSEAFDDAELDRRIRIELGAVAR